MLFNLSSKEACKKFLSDFLNVSDVIIEQYIMLSGNDVCEDDFLKHTDRFIDNKNVDELHLSVTHITTNDDECQTIKEIGLVNLQQALTMDTPLRRYLKQYDIQFDIINNLMIVKDSFDEIKYDSSSSEVDKKNKKLKSIAKKIYFDYQINGFFCVRDPKSYGGRVHLRPEIIYNLAQLSSKPFEFERGWTEKVKPYLIKFNAPIEYFAYYTFYSNIDDFEDDYTEKLELKRWLLKKSLRTVWKYYHNKQFSCEIIAYLKPEVCIPFHLITEIRPI